MSTIVNGQAERPFDVRWTAREADSLRAALDQLASAVIEMMCADPMRQTAEERRNVVKYISAMAAVVRHPHG